MNAMTSAHPAARTAARTATHGPSPRTINLAASTYQPRGEREFGAGYGRSQGYAAAQRSYLNSSRPSLFRVM